MGVGKFVQSCILVGGWCGLLKVEVVSVNPSCGRRQFLIIWCSGGVDIERSLTDHSHEVWLDA